MNDGWLTLISALGGTALGGLLSLVGTWVSLRGRPDYFDDMAKKYFADLLKEGDGKTMTELCVAGKEIGMSDNETKQIVFMVGARKSDKNNKWSL